MKERLQKLISRAGICSRRKAEELITSGLVTVNGEIAELGQTASAESDEIIVDGKLLKIKAERLYIILNKPQSYVTTMADEKGRRSVSLLVESLGERLYPVGRLDMYTEGLLLMTNDGDIAYKLTHPSHEIKKTYHAWVTSENMEKSLAKMATSLDIDGYKIKPAIIKKLAEERGKTKISITIHEGRNRQIRKMCDLSDLTLYTLCRVSVGELELGNLAVGEFRKLTEKELDYLNKITI